MGSTATTGHHSTTGHSTTGTGSLLADIKAEEHRIQAEIQAFVFQLFLTEQADSGASHERRKHEAKELSHQQKLAADERSVAVSFFDPKNVLTCR